MSITAAWHQAIFCLDGYPHNEDKIWQMANAKVESVLPSKILEIKNNPPEPTDIFSDNDEGIMPKHVHDTNTEFDLRYPGKNTIKLEPYLHTCINLKIALEISVTIMVQLVFRNSLAKKGINIRERIINARYVENIIAMLQNDSEKAYVIEPNERIAQTIFLSLVKIAQLVSVENRKKLGITARGI
ncbi:hypothetical protein G9A89_019997 [Geosiphon pyriformis]|nr:hypothetical protein G9A89_019997 [Geosiphon pyriformis]